MSKILSRKQRKTTEKKLEKGIKVFLKRKKKKIDSMFMKYGNVNLSEDEKQKLAEYRKKVIE